MQRWEYLWLCIYGHNSDTLGGAKNIVVNTSDGRWQREKMPNDSMTVVEIVNQLGSEGWEMVSSSDWSLHYYPTPRGFFAAVFKRPLS
jgi:hypothetical protein